MDFRKRILQSDKHRLLLAFSLILVFGLTHPSAQAQTYTQQTLHAFGGGTDGASPQAALINVNGILYGTTSAGGNSNKGTIYSYNPTTNIVTTLYQFTGTSTDGATPVASLVNVNGTLYGTTSAGGTSNKGTVFSYNPTTNTESILYSFKGDPDGVKPVAGLTYVNGTLYGTAQNNGVSSNFGDVFSLKPDGTDFQVVHSFLGRGYRGVDGVYPASSLLNVNGVLFGTTGYLQGTGSVFAINLTTNAEILPYSFNGSGSGLLNVNGTLYGATSSNYYSSGTIYSLNPTTYASKVLSTFPGDGQSGNAVNPVGDLVYDSVSGRIYGVTFTGGSTNGGTVYSLDLTTKQAQTVYSFASGSTPLAGLLLVNGTLYGTTSSSGAHGKGTLFSIKITPTAPVAVNDSGKAAYNTTLNITAPGVLGNDSNGGKAPISASLVTSPTHGTITFHSDGSFIYIPSTNYLGTDSFTYQDTNSLGTSNIATCALTVQARTPIAVNDNARTAFNTTLNITAPGVLGNDNTGGSTPLTATLSIAPAHGKITLNSDGSFQYIPNAGYLGTDSFSYYATNAVGNSNVATCTLTIQARTPVAVNDTAVTQYGKTLNVAAPGVLGNDNPGDTETLTPAVVTGPVHGTVILNSDGSYVYTPAVGFSGPDSFTYQDTNAIGTSNIATVSVTVQGEIPIANSDSYLTGVNTPLIISAPGVVSNDYIGDMDAFAAVQLSQPSHGTVVFSNDGSFMYTPNPGYTGTDGFLYCDSNAIGVSNLAAIVITVK